MTQAPIGYEIRTEINEFDPSLKMLVAYSTKDGGYIGLRERAEHLEARGIAPELIPGNRVCSIGFCDREQKWYGWSHRAIFGFGIGDTVKRGDIGYTGSTPEEMIEDRYSFFASISEECAKRKVAECQILPDRSGIRILHEPMKIRAVKLDDVSDLLAGEDVPMAETTLYENAFSILKVGRGEWTAQTLEDAKQMAIDFADAVR